MARGEVAQGTEEVGDVSAAKGEDGGEEEDDQAEEGWPCKGGGECVEQLACLAWQSVMEVSEFTSRALGLACLACFETAALGVAESLLLSLGYTGHGGLLVWRTGSGLPVIPARRPALEQLRKTAKVELRLYYAPRCVRRMALA
jgi:hypothetical protein